MSSMKLETLIKQFPEEREALQRLQEHLSRWMQSSKYKEFTWERACELVEPHSQNVLLEVLSELCEEGVISSRVRVMSPSGAAIKDFLSVLDVPLKLNDWSNGQEILVDLDNLKTVFIVTKQLPQ